MFGNSSQRHSMCPYLNRLFAFLESFLRERTGWVGAARPRLSAISEQRGVPKGKSLRPMKVMSSQLFVLHYLFGGSVQRGETRKSERTTTGEAAKELGIIVGEEGA